MTQFRPGGHGEVAEPESPYLELLWATFGGLALSHFWKALHLGYDALPDKELKQRVRWDVYLLVLRAIAMFMMAAHGLAFILVPLMAIGLGMRLW